MANIKPTTLENVQQYDAAGIPIFDYAKCQLVLTDAGIKMLEQKLQHQRWVIMLSRRPDGRRYFQTSSPEFLLEILSDITDALNGTVPNLNMIKQLSDSRLDVPDIETMKCYFGYEFARWIDYYHYILEHNPELIESPQLVLDIVPEDVMAERLSGRPWTETMAHRKSRAAVDSGYDSLALEVLSDIIWANDDLLPSSEMIRRLQRRMNIPSYNWFLSRLGPKATWLSQVETYRAEHPTTHSPKSWREEEDSIWQKFVMYGLELTQIQ